MKTNSLIQTLAIVSSCFISAHASAVDERWYISPALSYLAPDSDRQSDDGLGFKLGLGKAISNSWDLEASLATDRFDIKNSSDNFSQNSLGLDALFYFSRNSHFAPYIVMGAGAISTKVTNEHTNAMMNVGLGFKSDLTNSGIALRTDLRYREDLDDKTVTNQSSFGDWVFNLGLIFPLGEKARSAPVAVAAAPMSLPPMDSDADGVLDKVDLCPNTPAGAKINAQGCEPDSDKDGVVDSLDQCMNTPEGVTVNYQGCELDTDYDGVVDSKDQCPATMAGIKVNINGCPIPEVIILKDVNFEVNSDRLTQGSFAVLDKAADDLLKRPELKIEVSGYTDDRGSDSLNQALSQKRAQTVSTYMISRGVKASCLTVKGYGEENPVASNDTAAGRAENRRVELHILENPF